jgi:hypothetical protein
LFAAGTFEMGGDLGCCPFAALSAEQVADSPKLLFQGFGERLLFRGGDRTFGFGYDTCNKVLEPVYDVKATYSSAGKLIVGVTSNSTPRKVLNS